MQRFRIIAPEDNTPETQTSLEQSIYLLKQSGNLVRTENTAGEPCEPAKEYDENYEPFVPSEEQQKVIDEITVLAAEVDLEIVAIGGGIKNPK